MNTIFTSDIENEEDSLLKRYRKLAKNKPVLCSQVQPWKNENITHEMMLDDLKGCVIRHYLSYKFGTVGYTLQDATSDAYQALIKAIEKDKCAPTLANKIVKCPKCSHNIKMPTKFAGDERANHICMESPRPMKYRKFWIDCVNCNHGFWKKIYKVNFSTLVFPFIRSAIQRNANKWRRSNVVPMHIYSNNNHTIENRGSVLSIDGPQTMNGEECAIKNFLVTPNTKEQEKIPSSVITLLRNIISNMPPNHQIAIAFNRGIGGLVTGVVSRKIKCRYCYDYKNKPTEFDAEIDYSLNNNTVVCPECKCENEVNMQLSQTAIAKYLDITKQRVGRIINTAEKRLFDSLKNQINFDLL